MIKTEDVFFQRNMDSAIFSSHQFGKMVVSALLAGKEWDFAKKQPGITKNKDLTYKQA
jgi:hypothetical protein